MDNQKPRYWTQKAIDYLADKFSLPNDRGMQDWAWEVADPNQLENYYLLYDSIFDEDIKFVLMDMIIQATDGKVEEDDNYDFEEKLTRRLINNFELHNCQILYWSCQGVETENRIWMVTPLMRDLWNKRDIIKKRILFICTVNRMRSATAHRLYCHDLRFDIKSAGTDKSADTFLTKDHLNWADSVVVMEKQHRNYIRKHYPDIYKNKKIVCLYIPDD